MPVTDERKVENRAVFCWTRNRNNLTITKSIVFLVMFVSKPTSCLPPRSPGDWPARRESQLLFQSQSNMKVISPSLSTLN